MLDDIVIDPQELEQNGQVTVTGVLDLGVLSGQEFQQIFVDGVPYDADGDGTPDAPGVVSFGPLQVGGWEISGPGWTFQLITTPDTDNIFSKGQYTLTVTQAATSLPTFGFGLSDGAGGPVTVETMEVTYSGLQLSLDPASVVEGDSSPVTGDVAADAGAFVTTFTYTVGTDSDGLPLFQTAAAGSTVQTDAGGSLTVNADGTWSYTPPASYDHSQTDGLSFDDSFSVNVDDGSGTITSGTQVISVTDDTPVGVTQPAESATETNVDGVSGNLTTADSLGADGGSIASFSYLGDDGSGNPTSITAAAGTTVQTALGGSLTVNADGTWSYMPPSSVDNSNPVSENFSYTLLDSDGDTAVGNQSIDIADAGAAATVQSESATLSEAALADGTAPDAAALTASGTFADNFDFGGDGVGTVTGVSFNGLNFAPDATGGITVADPAWQFQVNADGSYSFTLTDAVQHGAGASDLQLPVFQVTMEDAVDGSSATSELAVTIQDDAPMVVASPAASVEEGSGASGVSGDVFSDDLGGADGAQLVFFSYQGTDSDGLPVTQSANAGETVQTASGGSLTVNADGSWSYVPPASVDNSAPVTETFNYSLRDADGDLSTGSQDISITDDAMSVTNASDSAALSEAALASGTAPDAAALTASGTFADNFDFGADGAGAVTNVNFDGADYQPDISGNTTIDGGDWQLQVAADGSYSFTLSGALSHGAGAADLQLPTFQVTMSDGTGDSSAAADLNVTIQDDAPVVTNAAPASVQEGSGGPGVSGDVLADDLPGADGASVVAFSYTGSDSDGLPIAMTAAAGDTVQTHLGGSLTVNADGSWNYVPPASVANNGGATESFGYDIMDSDGDVATGSQDIEITDGDISVIDASEEGTVSESALADGSAPDPSALSVSGNFADNFDFGTDGVGSVTGVSFDGTTYSPDASGNVTVDGGAWQLQVAADGSYSFTLSGAVAHGAGAASLQLPAFQVTMNDGAGDSSATTQLVMTIEDDAPVLVADSGASVEEGAGGAGISGNVLANDMQGADGAAVSSFSYGETDSDGLPITVPAGTTVQTALGGSLTVNADGSWNYVPPASVDNSGAVTETIGYTVTDGDGDTAFGTQEITITDDAMTVTTSSEAATVSESALDSGSAPDAAGRSATGSFADNFDFGADGAGVITGVSFNGSNFGPDSTGTITIADAAWQLQVNADGSYSFTLLDGVSHGAGELALDLPAFEVTMSDGTGDSSASTLLNVTIADDAPVLTADDPASVEAGAGQAVSGNVMSNDQGGADGASVQSFTYNGTDAGGSTVQMTALAGTTVETALGASLTVNADGSWSYQAPAEFESNAAAQDGFSFEIADGDGDVASGQQNISLQPNSQGGGGDNSAPVAKDDVIITSADNDGPIVIPTSVLLSNDMDPDGDTISVAGVGSPVGGSVSLSGEQVTFMPGAASGTQLRSASSSESDGSGRFTYRVSDGSMQAEAGVEVRYVDSWRLKGNDEDNIIVGGDRSERIYAKDGDDVVVAGGGHDRVSGGDGNDYVDGGDGHDRVWGGDGNDTLLGGDGHDYLSGGDGNDYVDGGDGHDRLRGGDGDDTLRGGEGHDSLSGGDGNDDLDGGDGHDRLWGGDGDDNLVGGDGHDRLGGGDGNDSLDGGDGHDRLWGGDGNDELTGGDGHDRLGGGDGNDSLDGGDGHDRLWGGDGNDELTGGDGHDYLGGGDGNDSLDGGDGHDRLSGGSGNDEMDGGAGDDRLYGSRGDDTLRGGEGRDKLSGGSGNDDLRGGDGYDRLYGGSGNDRLEGGEGADYLFGGSGSDTFVYNSLSDGGDVIRGFDASEDTIDISTLLQSIGYGGSDPLADGVLVLHDRCGSVEVAIDPSGNGGADGSQSLVRILGTSSSDLTSADAFDIT